MFQLVHKPHKFESWNRIFFCTFSEFKKTDIYIAFIDYGHLKPNSNLSTNYGCTQTNIQFEQEAVWLTQALILAPIERYRTVILSNTSIVFRKDELYKNVVCANFAHVFHQFELK